ncbi:MAG: hypothetical protein QNJ69_14050 [Gammaproteobacteria bacterium]|nr:hypothetical protein [Gammaproteobacteria bacterium]
MGLLKTAGKLTWGATKLSVKAATKTTEIATKSSIGAAKVAYKHRNKIGSAASSTVNVAAKTTSISTKAACKISSATVKTGYKHREKIAGAAVGTLKGTASVIHDTSGNLVSSNSIKSYVRTLENQSCTYRDLTDRFNRRFTKPRLQNSVLLDTLAVGGETLATHINSGQLPGEIQLAFELAYPREAAAQSFAEQVESLDQQELVGFVSGIKGKLFEHQYVDYLNNGRLPDGYSAELANNPTNPGWDIAIHGENGVLQETIQAKATDSVSYVREALEKHPQIDVVTTSEVHSHLLMHGISEGVIDSGISNSELTAMIEGSLGKDSISMDWMPSTVLFALIAFSAYNEEGLSSYEKSRDFGERSLKSYLAYLAGGSLAVATNTWWIGVLASMGSRLIQGGGRRKREQLKNLKQLVNSNQAVLNRLERQLA